MLCLLNIPTKREGEAMTHADWIGLLIVLDIAAIFALCAIFKRDYEEDDL